MLIYLTHIEAPKDKLRFSALYFKYHRLMFAVANNILNNPSDAEDAVQDAFFAIAKNFSKIDEISSPKTKCYIVTITENKAKDIYRRKAKTNNADMELAPVKVDFEFSDGSLANAMSRLPEKYRQALSLRFLCGFSVREIAEIMELEYENTRKLIYRARESLRSELKKDGVDL